MNITEFNYELPKNRIAQRPPLKRGKAKLLVLDRDLGALYDKKYEELIDYLNPGDVLVLNNTKVMKARLFGVTQDGKTHELLLLENHHQASNKYHHKILYRGRLRLHEVLKIGNVEARIDKVYKNGIALLSSEVDFHKLTKKYGQVPLPPYIKRTADQEDAVRYQTEFAKVIGSVAAPTASLNMTKSLLDKLKSKEVKLCYVTLHVGIGTFQPVRVDEIEKHRMHSEWFHIPKNTVIAIKKAKANYNKVVAVGTTVVRALEAASQSILSNPPQSISSEAKLFIRPGYKFKVVDRLITNFHAPKTSVLILAMSFGGINNIRNAYRHALKNDYQFLSYGDSMLIY